MLLLNAHSAFVIADACHGQSDVYYAGTLLSESFGNYTKLVTGGKGTYCTTAQEDNATLESMVRGELPVPCPRLSPFAITHRRAFFFSSSSQGRLDGLLPRYDPPHRIRL